MNFMTNLKSFARADEGQDLLEYALLVALIALIAIGAVGASLVWGVLRIGNFAHGDYMALGAFTAFVVNILLGQNLIVAAIVGHALLIGALLRPFLGRLAPAPALTKNPVLTAR